MKRISFNDGWSYRIWGVPGAGQPVTLPHDYSMYLPRSADARSGSAGGFYQCANVIYDRELTVTRDMLAGRVLLEFEGVMANCQVYYMQVVSLTSAVGSRIIVAENGQFFQHIHSKTLQNQTFVR